MPVVNEFEDALSGPQPAAFCALTLKVYVVLLDNPLTKIGEQVPVPVRQPGVEIAVYPVIADPPLDVGAVKSTLARAPQRLAVPIVGAPGTVYGVTEQLAVLHEPVPLALAAFTLNVYAVPLVNPDTTIGADAPVFVNPPGEDVAVYVTGKPPVQQGPEKLTETDAFEGVPDTQ